MEIVTLIENSSRESQLQAEFGLSLLVRCAGGTILFDMGSSAAFTENAAKLHVDLQEVDCAVLSHAHYDHGGGLAAFAEKNSTAPVYTATGADGDYYGNVGAKMGPVLHSLVYPIIATNPHFCRYVGLDKEVVSSLKDRHRVVTTRTEILANVFLLTQLKNSYPRPEGNKYLLEKTAAGMQQDSFDHELIMVIREDDGLTIFTGCGHRGIVNMLATVQASFGGEEIKAVIGGFHLARQPGKPYLAGSRQDVAEIATRFKEAGVTRVITGHCTGDGACGVLREELADRLSVMSTGAVYAI